MRATVLGAGIAWAVALVPMTIGDRLDEIAPLLLGLGGVGLGVFFLASMGGLQWLVLREYLPGAGAWVPAVAAGWIVGLAAFTAVASPLWQEGQELGLIVLIAILGGVAMASAMAATSGLALVRILGRGDRHDLG